MGNGQVARRLYKFAATASYRRHCRQFLRRENPKSPPSSQQRDVQTLLRPKSWHYRLPADSLFFLNRYLTTATLRSCISVDSGFTALNVLTSGFRKDAVDKFVCFCVSTRLREVNGEEQEVLMLYLSRCIRRLSLPQAVSLLQVATERLSSPRLIHKLLHQITRLLPSTYDPVDEETHSILAKALVSKTNQDVQQQWSMALVPYPYPIHYLIEAFSALNTLCAPSDVILRWTLGYYLEYFYSFPLIIVFKCFRILFEAMLHGKEVAKSIIPLLNSQCEVFLQAASESKQPIDYLKSCILSTSSSSLEKPAPQMPDATLEIRDLAGTFVQIHKHKATDFQLLSNAILKFMKGILPFCHMQDMESFHMIIQTVGELEADFIQCVYGRIVELKPSLSPYDTDLLIQSFLKSGVYDEACSDVAIQNMAQRLDEFTGSFLYNAMMWLSRYPWPLTRDFVNNMCERAITQLNQLSIEEVIGITGCLGRLKCRELFMKRFTSALGLLIEANIVNFSVRSIFSGIVEVGKVDDSRCLSLLRSIQPRFFIEKPLLSVSLWSPIIAIFVSNISRLESFYATKTLVETYLPLMLQQCITETMQPLHLPVAVNLLALLAELQTRDCLWIEQLLYIIIGNRGAPALNNRTSEDAFDIPYVPYYYNMFPNCSFDIRVCQMNLNILETFQFRMILSSLHKLAYYSRLSMHLMLQIKCAMERRIYDARALDILELLILFRDWNFYDWDIPYNSWDDELYDERSSTSDDNAASSYGVGDAEDIERLFDEYTNQCVDYYLSTCNALDTLDDPLFLRCIENHFLNSRAVRWRSVFECFDEQSHCLKWKESLMNSCLEGLLRHERYITANPFAFFRIQLFYDLLMNGLYVTSVSPHTATSGPILGAAESVCSNVKEVEAVCWRFLDRIIKEQQPADESKEKHFSSASAKLLHLKDFANDLSDGSPFFRELFGLLNVSEPLRIVFDDSSLHLFMNCKIHAYPVDYIFCRYG